MKRIHNGLNYLLQHYRFIVAQGIVCLFLVCSPAGNAAQSGDFTYEATQSAITITGYTGPGGSVAVPGTIDATPVTSIGARAFLDSWVTSVTLPNSVSSIGNQAFANCTRLSDVTLPNNLTSMGEYAFFGCGLTRLALPDSLASIADFAFAYCTFLTSLTLPSGVTSIGIRAFNECHLLTNVTLPNSVTRLGREAFSGCIALTNITFSENLKIIAWGTFSSCRKLTSVALPNSVTGIDGDTFRDCITLTSIALPNGVTRLGGYTFRGCVKLTSIVLPTGLTNVGDLAFSDCTGLTSVYFQGNAPALGETVFENANKATVYHLASAAGWGPTFGGRPTAVWELSYSQWADFSGLAARYPAASAEQDDPDKDGLTNIQEMAAGTDPTDRNSALGFEALARPADLSEDDRTDIGPNQFALYFQSIPGKTYEIEAAEVLGGTWSTVASATATTTQKRLLLDRPATQRFYRVVIR